MWAVGCIFGELLRNEPLFPGRTEVDMLERMVRLLGSPSEAIWPVRVPYPTPLSLPAPAKDGLRMYQGVERMVRLLGTPSEAIWKVRFS